MRLSGSRKILVRAVLSVSLLGTILAGHPTTAQTVAPGKELGNPTDPSTAYQEANGLYKQGRFQEAAKKFRELFADDRGRKASTAMGLAQSERLSGNFAAALYFYSFAANEYARRNDDVEALDWRTAITGHVAALARNLVPVEVRLVPGAKAATGDLLCGVEIDGQIPVRVDVAALSASLIPAALPYVDRMWIDSLLKNLEGGWLAGVVAPATGRDRCESSAAPPDRARLIMSRTQAHPVKVNRWVDGKARAAAFTVTFEELQLPTPQLNLAELRAAVTLEPTTDSMNAPATSVRAGLTPVEGGDRADYPVLWKEPTDIPAGRYRPTVNVPGLLARLPAEEVDVLPGERLTLQVKLLQTPIYRRKEFYLAVGITAALVGGVVYLLATKPDRPRPDSGSLDWTVRVP